MKLLVLFVGDVPAVLIALLGAFTILALAAAWWALVRLRRVEALAARTVATEALLAQAVELNHWHQHDLTDAMYHVLRLAKEKPKALRSLQEWCMLEVDAAQNLAAATPPRSAAL